MKNLIVVNFNKKEVLLKLSEKEVVSKYNYLIINFNDSFNLEEIKKFNFRNNCKVIKNNIKKVS